MVRRHYLVTGRVQGVGFRNFVHRSAKALRIKGAVRNLADGRVEIAVAVEEERAESLLTEFESAISKGPLLARVDHVARTQKEVVTGFQFEDTFQIVSDGQQPWEDAQ